MEIGIETDLLDQAVLTTDIGASFILHVNIYVHVYYMLQLLPQSFVSKSEITVKGSAYCIIPAARFD